MLVLAPGSWPNAWPLRWGVTVRYVVSISAKTCCPIPMFNPEYHDNTYAKHAFGITASFAVGRRGVTQEEADAWLAEFTELGKQGKFFFSLNRYLFVAVKISAK